MNSLINSFLSQIGHTELKDSIPSPHPDVYLLHLKEHLILLGQQEEVKKGVLAFLEGDYLKNFRQVRALYHHPDAKELVLDNLISTRDGITTILKEHYGPFTYGPHESAFDEYLISMREAFGVTYNDQQILKHAGVRSIEDIPALGYTGKHQYVIDRVSPREREALLIENGGLSYHQWIEQEIQRFLTNPALLIREYSCIFENLFPDMVQVGTESFINQISHLDLPLLIEIILGKKNKLESILVEDQQIYYIQNIDPDMEKFWGRRST